MFTHTELTVSLNHQPFGGAPSGQMEQNLNSLAIIISTVYGIEKGKAFNPKITFPTVKHGDGSIVYHGVLLGKGLEQLKEDYSEMPKQHLKTSARKLKLLKLGLQTILKKPSTGVIKWFNDIQVKILQWSSRSPDLNPSEHVWTELRKRDWVRRPTKLTDLLQFCQEKRAKTPCTERSFWKVSFQIKPLKVNNTKR